MARTSSTQWRTMIFYTKVYSAFFVDKWVPAVTGMAHSDRGWTCGWTGKTVRSLKNTCHTWALLRWWFTTKRRLVYAPLPLRLSILTKTTCVHFLSTSEVMIQYIWRYIKCSHLYLYLYEYVINNNNNNNLPAVLVRLTATLHPRVFCSARRVVSAWRRRGPAGTDSQTLKTSWNDHLHRPCHSHRLQSSLHQQITRWYDRLALSEPGLSTYHSSSVCDRYAKYLLAGLISTPASVQIQAGVRR